MPLTIAKILQGVEDLSYQLDTESRLVRAGLKDTQDTDAIMGRFEWLATLPAVKLTQTQLLRAKKPDEKERLERLYFTCVGMYTYRKQAKLDDELQSALAQEKVNVNGDAIPYYNLSSRLMNESNFAKREEYGAAIDGVHKKFNPLKLNQLQRELRTMKRDLGFKSYVGFCEAQKQFNYEKFIELLSESAKNTSLLYRDHIGKWVKSKVGKAFRNADGKPALNRYHASYLLKLGDYDARFPKKEMLATLLGSMKSMGIDIKAKPNIKLDVEERDKKNPRACVFPAKIPKEVHLLLKPVGGMTDYETFLHEAGHAAHFGFSDPKLPYEYRHLSRSHALSETYAFLFQNITLDALWLQEVMHMPRKVAQTIRYYRVLCDLFMYRRYIAKLRAEHDFFRQHEEKGDEALSDGAIYAAKLTEHTGFIYQPYNYLFDMDGAFYSADYLRAWVGEAQLLDYLQRTHGPRWWAEKNAGKFLTDLFHTSCSKEAEQVLSELGYQPLDPSHLERRFAELESLLSE